MLVMPYSSCQISFVIFVVEGVVVGIAESLASHGGRLYVATRTAVVVYRLWTVHQEYQLLPPSNDTQLTAMSTCEFRPAMSTDRTSEYLILGFDDGTLQFFLLPTPSE